MRVSCPTAVLAAAMMLMPSGLSAAEAIVLESLPTQVTLVELFTSEGCSSCPPADAWLAGFRDSPDLWTGIVPVGFHVTYWNRLGWTDRMSRPEFTRRQELYADSWVSGSVYTPAIIVNGREWRGRLAGAELTERSPARVGVLGVSGERDDAFEVVFQPAMTHDESLDSPSGRPSPGTHQRWVGEGSVEGREAIGLARDESLDAQGVLLGFDVATDVRAGENRGRVLRHEFVALTYAREPMVNEDGIHRATLRLPAPDDLSSRTYAVAFWVISQKGMAPLQAVGGYLPE